MTVLNVEPPTFLVREKGFDMRAFFVLRDGLIQIAHIRDQIDRLLSLRAQIGEGANQYNINPLLLPTNQMHISF
jgi:hypothetical protein